ncbi:hypothetical protein OROGR_022418 [Orobanche gracilis]
MSNKKPTPQQSGLVEVDEAPELVESSEQNDVKEDEQKKHPKVKAVDKANKKTCKGLSALLSSGQHQISRRERKRSCLLESRDELAKIREEKRESLREAKRKAKVEGRIVKKIHPRLL